MRTVLAVAIASAMVLTLGACSHTSGVEHSSGNKALRAMHGTASATALTGSGTHRVTPRDFHHVDVLFIGAHPDDEHGDLATFGQWTQAGVSVGELTLTRGEGGGDAVGSLSGPPLGLWREAEQRRAVGYAGIRNVYYLDKPDVYYMMSEILAAKAYNWRSTLGRVVRIVRETQPKVIVTMNPSPYHGQEGEHQIAARAAISAFRLAAEPEAYPEQITQEHLKPWVVSRIFIQAFPGTTPPGIGTVSPGPHCASSLKARDPSADNNGVWAGARSTKYHTTWAQVQVDGAHQYASQGFAVIPSAPTSPDKIRCEWFTQVASRVPFNPSDHSATAMLDGAVLHVHGGLPLGTRLSLMTSQYQVAPGAKVTVTAHITAPTHAALPAASLKVRLPAGWPTPKPVRLASITAGNSRVASFTITVPAGTTVDHRIRIGAVLSTAHGSGYTSLPLALVGSVSSTPPLLDETVAFNAWAAKYHVPQLKNNLVLPVFPLGRGQTRQFTATITNNTSRIESGAVVPTVPTGFSITPAVRKYQGLAAGESRKITFTLTSTDSGMSAGKAAPNDGNYPISIRTTSENGVTDVQHSAINLVPVTTIPEATAQPVVDGTQSSPGEYPGTVLDVSHVWQGQKCATASVCSATAKVSWYGTALYVLVDIKADSPGAIVAPSDCKQDWRTDAVGIDIFPRGTYTSVDLTKAMKLDVFPQTDAPTDGNPPCAQSDADFHQTNTYGQKISTKKLMPGLEVASKVPSPFTGYSVEVKIPFADLPSAVNPSHMGLNIINYYSNNDHLIGTTRLAWSAWRDVQAEPYRWGVAMLSGYKPADPSLARPVLLPNVGDPALGIDSPQSILQAARVVVPLSGAPLAPPDDQGWIVDEPRWSNGSVQVELRASGPGTFHAYVWDPATGRTDPKAGELGHASLVASGPGKFGLNVRLAEAPPQNAKLAVVFTSEAGGNVSSATSVYLGDVAITGHGTSAGESRLKPAREGQGH